MRFGAVPVKQAEGAILAHSLALPSGRLKKGRVLTNADIEGLLQAGIGEVVVARPDSDDLLEDEVAQRVAAALATNSADLNLRVAAPFTGRANLYAETAGILRVDVDIVNRLNGLDEALTLATLPDYSRVAPRQMLGTVKVIPYGAPEATVSAAQSLLLQQQVLRVHPVTARSATLILTETPGMKRSLVTKGGDAVRARLAVLGIADIHEQIVPHETVPLAAALRHSTSDLTLILTGSATSDRGDVGPISLIEAGGELARFGMPVDPGNLLFLGHLDDRPVIGLPGCARSPKLNGADWVLERLACGLTVTNADIAAMGVGGLLKEIPSRPQPRGGGSDAPRRPVIGGVLLAAGGSTRMRGADKLLEPVDGVPLIRKVAERMQDSGIDTIQVVLRPGDDARAAALSGLGLNLTPNPRAEEGMATSIAAGVAALKPECDAAMIVMADMPEVSSNDIDRMIAGFDPGESRAIIRAATADGRKGHPVLFGRRFFEALQRLEGDSGARVVVAEHPEFVVEVVLDRDSAVTDLDTPEAWADWRAKAV